jgi:hypothetical protein
MPLYTRYTRESISGFARYAPFIYFNNFLEENKIKQLGNLAIVCAQRRDIIMQILNGQVTVHVGQGPDRISFAVDWKDDEKILMLIIELNHGSLKGENISEGEKAA